MRLKIKYD